MFSKRNILIVVVVLLASGVFFAIVRTGRDFIATKDAQKTFGTATKVQREFIPLTEWGKRETTERKVIKEDFVVSSGTKVFENTEFLETGDIIVEGNGKLIFRNSLILMTPANAPKANIFVRGEGEIIFENSTLKPNLHDPANLYVYVSDSAAFTFNDSQGVHMLVASDNATVAMNDSIWAFYLPTFRGGGVRVSGAAQVDIKNSTIGGLAFDLPKDAKVDIRKFAPGVLKNWSAQKDLRMRGVDFNVTFENVEILGDYYEGGSVRGLALFVPSDIASLAVTDSQLNKLAIASTDETMSFDGLRLGVPSNFAYRNIKMKNSSVMAQWGFSINGGKGYFINSRGLWFLARNNAELTLKDSEVNDFDARNFTGVLDFENVLWKDAGEVMGGSDFTISGSWSAQGFDPTDFGPLRWSDSRVTRTFPIDIITLEPEPGFVRAAKIELFDKGGKLLFETYTDKSGRAYFAIPFNDKTYRDIFSVKISKGEKERKHPITFLTPTPIKLILK